MISVNFLVLLHHPSLSSNRLGIKIVFINVASKAYFSIFLSSEIDGISIISSLMQP